MQKEKEEALAKAQEEAAQRPPKIPFEATRGRALFVSRIFTLNGDVFF